MKRIALSLTLSLILLLPSIVRPPSVAAEWCGDTWSVVVITVLFRGVLTPFLYTCDPFGSGQPSDCPMTAVGASAARDNNNGRVDRFDYRLVGMCGDIHVTGSYAFATGETAERLDGNGRSIRGLWRCSSDPWIHPAGQAPICTRITIALAGDPTGWDAGAVSQAKLPLSVGLLSADSRRVLNGQLQNALNQLPPPAAPAPAPALKPAIIPSVRLGANGQHVDAIQYLLRQSGQDILIDGDFGEQTDASVRAFQAANGLTVDGIVGSATWRALWVTVRAGDASDAVSAVQSLLNRHGRDVVVDGSFEGQTEIAVRTFQREKRLTVDGVVGPQTWTALVSPPLDI